MTPLERLIREMIMAEGPMRLDRYMGLCLGHPRHGYYMARQPFGEQGDFVTAPEISQVFGELLGVWLMSTWVMLGRPSPFNLVELGPGRGTLMADILRAARSMPEFLDAARVHLVETSARLREMQRHTIIGEPTWHASLDTVPEGPLLLVANEFFDAIPIRQLECRDGRWRERVIGIDNDALRIGLGAPFAEQGRPPRDGQIVEIDDQRRHIADAIGQRLAQHPGAALIVDYGHLRSAPGDTLQALRRHTMVPITEAPGECDITSHVDFASLARAIGKGGAQPLPALAQGDFLRAMGLAERSAALAATASPEAAGQLRRAEARLADDAGMGKLFKVLAAVSPGVPAPYPFGP